MSIETHFQHDKEFIESLSPEELSQFEDWFAELNAENLKRENAFYSGVSLEKATGAKYWFDSFVDGYTPAEALDEEKKGSSITKTGWVIGIIMLILCVVVGYIVDPLVGFTALFSGFWVWIGIVIILMISSSIDKAKTKQMREPS